MYILRETNYFKSRRMQLNVRTERDHLLNSLSLPHFSTEIKVRNIPEILNIAEDKLVRKCSFLDVNGGTVGDKEWEG